MKILNVIAAAEGAFAFGAFWYMTFSKQWKKAAEIPTDANGRPKGSSSPMLFVIGFTAMILVAGMLRHVFHISGIVTLGGGFVAGLGIGAFFVTPWLAMNFSMRKPALTMIDGVNVIVGCSIIGVILSAF
ncbi:MAG: DUF1761 domain-containing protein [Rhodoferax sp.]|nr:DUF1761 domain-containing protein [Pseudorhodobacter sp.]